MIIVMNLLKGIIFSVIGIIIISMPYEKHELIFPATKSKWFKKIVGGGLFIFGLFVMGRLMF